jgi:hypothetical protein
MKLQGIAVAIILILIITGILFLFFRNQNIQTLKELKKELKVISIKPVEINNTFNRNEEKVFSFNISNSIDYEIKNLEIFSKISPDWKVNDKNVEFLKIFSLNKLEPKSFKTFDFKLKAPNVRFEYTFKIFASYNTSSKISSLLEFSKNGKVKYSKISDGYIDLKEIKANFSSFGKIPINFTIYYPDFVKIDKVEGIYRLENCKLIEKNLINCVVSVEEYKDYTEIAVELKVDYSVINEEIFSTSLKVV